MKLGHIELFVKDVAAAKNFYLDKLQFELVQSQDKGRLVWLKRDMMEFLLRRGNPNTTTTYQQANVGIVLYTDNLFKEKEELEKRGIQFLGIDGNNKCLTFTDPDGHWFQLVNPQDQ